LKFIFADVILEKCLVCQCENRQATESPAPKAPGEELNYLTLRNTLKLNFIFVVNV